MTGLYSNVELRIVKLAGNRIPSVSSLETLRNLESLDLSNNKICHLDDLRCLSFNVHLKSLWLSGNPVSKLKGYKVTCRNLLLGLYTLDGKKLFNSASARDDGMFQKQTTVLPNERIDGRKNYGTNLILRSFADAPTLSPSPPPRERKGYSSTLSPPRTHSASPTGYSRTQCSSSLSVSPSPISSQAFTPTHPQSYSLSYTVPGNSWDFATPGNNRDFRAASVAYPLTPPPLPPHLGLNLPTDPNPISPKLTGKMETYTAVKNTLPPNLAYMLPPPNVYSSPPQNGFVTHQTPISTCATPSNTSPTLLTASSTSPSPFTPSFPTTPFSNSPTSTTKNMPDQIFTEYSHSGLSSVSSSEAPTTSKSIFRSYNRTRTSSAPSSTPSSSHSTSHSSRKPEPLHTPIHTHPTHSASHSTHPKPRPPNAKYSAQPPSNPATHPPPTHSPPAHTPSNHHPQPPHTQTTNHIYSPPSPPNKHKDKPPLTHSHPHPHIHLHTSSHTSPTLPHTTIHMSVTPSSEQGKHILLKP
eukprot:Phypoly_transcript_03732.p1 GENE.Phypoly_transcript_03732~~Phypoly_transcript_03732.p1  ORF type:complete len:537 (-),score=111.13 Phypoly_transcript_03732:761-2335(-)